MKDIRTFVYFFSNKTEKNCDFDTVLSRGENVPSERIDNYE